jgi:enoyl-CoA hydratase/carnithine racemase
VAERAGPARARELAMTARVYPAEEMVRWGVANRVLPDEELTEKGLAFAHKLADGPTRAHAATKKIIRAWLDDGIEKADEITPAVAGALFDTADLKAAVKTFLAEGPGNATFEGR